jgi:hypothetical protein
MNFWSLMKHGLRAISVFISVGRRKPEEFVLMRDAPNLILGKTTAYSKSTSAAAR